MRLDDILKLDEFQAIQAVYGVVDDYRDNNDFSSMDGFISSMILKLKCSSFRIMTALLLYTKIFRAELPNRAQLIEHARKVGALDNSVTSSEVSYTLKDIA